MELFRLLGVVAVDNSQAMSAIDETVQHAKKSDSMLSSLGKGMTKIGNGFTKYITKPALLAGAALAGVTLKKGWDRMVEIDNAKVKLEAIGNSTEDVKNIMENANAAVKGTSYGLNEAATTAASAVAAGIAPGKELERYLTNVSDAAAVAGVDMAEMGSVMNKVATQGKANNEVLLQMADSGIPIYQYLADELGVTADAVFDMASRGEIDLETFQRAVEKNIGGAAKIMGSKTISGAISNIWASIGRIGANFLGAGDDANTFAGKLLPVLNDVTKWLGGVEDKAKEWGATFGDVFQKVVDVISAIPGKVKGITIIGAILIGPFLKLTGSILTSMGALSQFKSASEGASLTMGVLRGQIKLSEVMLGKFGGALAATPGKIKGAFTAMHGAITQQIAAFRMQNARLKTTNTLYGANAMSIHRASTASAGNTAANILNAISTSKVGMATKSAATRMLAFAAAHKVAMLASLGVIGALVGLGVYMSKTGKDADQIAARITAFADKLATGITQFADKIPGMVEAFTGAIITVVQSIVSILPSLIPTIVQAGLALFMGLIQALTQIVEPLVSTIPQVIGAVVDALPVLIPALITGAITLFMAIVQAIPKIIPPLVEAIPTIVIAVVEALPVLIPALLEGAIQLFMAFVQAIPIIVPALISSLGLIVQALWTTLVSGVSSAWDSIKSATSEKWNQIKAGIMQPIEAARVLVGNVINGIKGIASNGWNSIKSTASSVWNGIKNAITSPIEAAKNAVKRVIDTIKGFFNFKISWPKIPMPHFSINPPGWKIGDLLKGKIPKLGIAWKAKGGIFDKPTIFDTRYGLQGVGEAGPEAVAPIDTLQKYVAEAVASQNGGLLKGIYELIEEIRMLREDVNVNFDESNNREIKFNDRELGRLVKQYG